MVSDIKTDYYDILECGPHTTATEIQQIYRAKAKRLHPDKNPPNTPSTEWEKLREAYEILGNPHTKAQYDKWRKSNLPVPFNKWISSSTAMHWAFDYQKAIQPVRNVELKGKDLFEMFRNYEI